MQLIIALLFLPIVFTSLLLTPVHVFTILLIATQNTVFMENMKYLNPYTDNLGRFHTISAFKPIHRVCYIYALLHCHSQRVYPHPCIKEQPAPIFSSLPPFIFREPKIVGSIFVSVLTI